MNTTFQQYGHYKGLELYKKAQSHFRGLNANNEFVWVTRTDWEARDKFGMVFAVHDGPLSLLKKRINCVCTDFIDIPERGSVCANCGLEEDQ